MDFIMQIYLMLIQRRKGRSSIFLLVAAEVPMPCCQCRQAWEGQGDMEQMETVDIDQGQEEAEDDADEGTDVMPTEEQAVFHRRPSR